MPKPGVYRSPWRDFPDVVIQTTITHLRSRPGYSEAKRGAGDAAGFGGTKVALPGSVHERLLDRFPAQAEVLANELGFSPGCFTNREARFFAGLKTEYDLQLLIDAARELSAIQQRQASLSLADEIELPSR
jgi:hypothetical protein